ncbi:glycine-rich domain-containing protein [Streptomyces sp. NPDC054797]
MSTPYPPPPPCSAGKGETPTPAYTGSTTLVTAQATPRGLLSDADFNAVMHTILDNNPGMDPFLASRILVDALAFLATAARTVGGLAPSRVVDEGWHALILHTGLYQNLCARLGGFVHHVPERPDPGRRSQSSIEQTIDAIEAAGYTVDRELWRGPTDTTVTVAANCQHSGPEGPIVIIPKPKG